MNRMKRKSLILSILVLTTLSPSITAQKLNFNTLLSFMKSDISRVEDILQLSGYEFGHKQEQDSLSNYYSEEWDYKTDSLQYNILLSASSLTQLVNGVTYFLYNKNQYLNILGSLKKYGFVRYGPMTIVENMITEEFKNMDIHTIMTTDKKNSYTLYTVDICFCTVYKNGEKIVNILK